MRPLATGASERSDSGTVIFSSITPEELVAAVTKAIVESETEVLISARSPGEGKIVAELIRASDRGVDVWLLLDNNNASANAVREMQRRGFKGKIRWSDKPLYGQQLVSDQRSVLQTSQPWALRQGSSDSVTYVSKGAEVAKHREAFAQAWKQGRAIN